MFNQNFRVISVNIRGNIVLHPFGIRSEAIWFAKENRGVVIDLRNSLDQSIPLIVADHRIEDMGYENYLKISRAMERYGYVKEKDNFWELQPKAFEVLNRLKKSEPDAIVYCSGGMGCFTFSIVKDGERYTHSYKYSIFDKDSTVNIVAIILERFHQYECNRFIGQVCEVDIASLYPTSPIIETEENMQKIRDFINKRFGRKD